MNEPRSAFPFEDLDTWNLRMFSEVVDQTAEKIARRDGDLPISAIDLPSNALSRRLRRFCEDYELKTIRDLRVFGRRNFLETDGTGPKLEAFVDEHFGWLDYDTGICREFLPIDRETMRNRILSCRDQNQLSDLFHLLNGMLSATREAADINCGLQL